MPGGAGEPGHLHTGHIPLNNGTRYLLNLYLYRGLVEGGVAFELVVAVWLNAKPDKVRDVASV